MTKPGWNAIGLAILPAGLARLHFCAAMRKLAGIALTFGLVCTVAFPVAAGALPAPVAVGPSVTAGTIIPAGALFKVGEAYGSGAATEIEIADPAAPLHLFAQISATF